jgi:hypothetical protein
MNPEVILRVVEEMDPVIIKTQDDNNILSWDGALILLKVKVVVWSIHSPIYTAWWVDNLQLMIMNVQNARIEVILSRKSLHLSSNTNKFVKALFCHAVSKEHAISSNYFP